MIQETELRVGNCLYLGNEQTKIKLSKELFSLILSGDASLSKFKPIPLTEEMLLKCGFEYAESNNSWQLDAKYGFSFFGRIGQDFNCYCESDEFGNAFHYLHQLQNLYFALTNEELTINL